MTNDKITIIGVPNDLGQARRGVEEGPRALRAAGLAAALEKLGYEVVDAGDVPVYRFRKNDGHQKLKNLDSVVRVNEKLAAVVDGVIKEKRFPLILGGDHSIAIGALAGISKNYKNLGVIWFDAHGDLNTAETTLSGNIHGMPLAAGLGFGHFRLTSLYGYWPKVKTANVIIVGARSLDPGEEELIERIGIKTFAAAEIKKNGIAETTRAVISHFREKADGVHLSLDLDVLDPAAAPGVGTPVAGGLSYEETLAAMRILARSGLVTSLEVVEVNPRLDEDERTVKAAAGLIEGFFAARRHRRQP